MAKSTEAPLREADLQDAIVEAAMMLGWKVMHTRAARRGDGQWRTPLQGHKGFPDLVLVRPPRLIFAELKSATGRLTTEQENWLDAIDKCGGVDCPETFVWTPRHWRSGLVTEALK